MRTLKELARSYLAITRDLTRVMSRLKAIYRSWGIACAGQQVYAPRYRAEWLAKISEAGVRRRAEFYYQQFDALAALRQQARRKLLAESREHFAVKLLRQIPSIGPIRAALLVALIQTPHRRIVCGTKIIEAGLEIMCSLPVKCIGLGSPPEQVSQSPKTRLVQVTDLRNQPWYIDDWMEHMRRL